MFSNVTLGSIIATHKNEDGDFFAKDGSVYHIAWSNGKPSVTKTALSFEERAIRFAKNMGYVA
ncbi:MAG: hypothetical protein HDQ88_00795 [Clostridia bacterium]|nr:hypothetical protein [Clostridia bacterium]